MYITFHAKQGIWIQTFINDGGYSCKVTIPRELALDLIEKDVVMFIDDGKE